MFKRTSHFDQTQHVKPVEIRYAGPMPQPPSTDKTITKKQLEDWSYALEFAADEAGDNHLLVLESRLLDLRDEIVFELHRSM